MQEQKIARAGLLLEQNRISDAEKELKSILAENPVNAEALALLSICRAQNNAHEEALDLIRKALAESADNPRYLSFYANILLGKEDYKEAEKVIRNAISLFPMDADFYGTLARIHLSRKDWAKAFEAAENGLANDADNLSCLNARSTALIKLDKKEDAYETIREALNQDPENAFTHTNLGWGLLEKGEHKKALDHFRKALQINPEMEIAKAGLVEGLKARYFLYRLFLKYAFWIGNMKEKAQWGVIIGFYLLSKLMRMVSASNPELKPFITPLIILYFVFAFSTWVMSPLSNLFLRLNIYGRYALSKDEITASNFVGLSLIAGLSAGLLYLTTESAGWAAAGIVGVSMMIPLSGTFSIEGKKRNYMLGYCLLLLLTGMTGVFQAFQTDEVFSTAALIYLVGIMAFQWVANFFLVRT